MIWILALGLGLLGLWLWRMQRAKQSPEQSDFAKWKRDLASKEREQRKPQPPSARRLERQRYDPERHY